MRKFKLFEGVVLLEDLEDPLVPKGTYGVIMELLPPDGIAVELFDAEGETIDVAFILETYVRAPTDEERDASRQAGERATDRWVKAIVPNEPTE